MKRCKNCREKFQPRFNTLEGYCWAPECKTIEALQKLEKLKKNDNRLQQQKRKAIKEQLKTASQWKKDLQTIFNTFIRLRDAGANCISCDKPLRGKYDAGHFYNVGNYPGLRYNELNVWGQCVECNQFQGGRVHEYRLNLIKRIGAEKVTELEANRHKLQKISIPEIRELISKYKGFVAEMKK
ncbi:Bacteriophage lambda NinG [uncultured Caudovirales phage]|uniref:Protein ninG n=1 Tax=uncultured Caudovirales phage TaxID=2100421 RepID=A0A6J5N6B5_9CAUD|nr:Bacteriophage lambda NinG [uncultured Caudovirales phage]